ncbi:hypothetical protein BK133_20205, partial [Paenibacillus sp. FSL H8-0548]
MKRFSAYSSILASALVLILLSGCVQQRNQVEFRFEDDVLSGSQHVFVRYSDRTVTDQQDDIGKTSVTVSTYDSKKIVGGYVYDGNVSWVPNYSYSFDFNLPAIVFVSGILEHRPDSAADHVVLAKEPEKVIKESGDFVDLTFAVYDSYGELVDDRTEIFAHSTDSSLIFWDTDPVSSNGEVEEGFSSYTVGGLVTFLIKTDINHIMEKPISLYSGPKLISKNFFKVVESIEVSSAGDVSSLKVGDTLEMSAGILPVDAKQKTVTWSVENGTGSASINASGLLTPVSAGTVTVKATATDGTGVEGTKVITITVPVNAITVTAAGEASTVATGSSL